MIEVIPAPDHVAAFRIMGTLTAEDYDEMIPQIEEKLRDHDEIGVFVDMEGFEDMTAEAMRRDVKYGIDKLGELHRFGRAAIATDKHWIKAATEMAHRSSRRSRPGCFRQTRRIKRCPGSWGSRATRRFAFAF